MDEGLDAGGAGVVANLQANRDGIAEAGQSQAITLDIEQISILAERNNLRIHSHPADRPPEPERLEEFPE